jgi:membrane-bound lytic murein transglycosylase A
MKMRHRRFGAGNLLAWGALLGFAALGFVAAGQAAENRYALKAATFADLPGFSSDNHDEALRAFVSTCASPPRSSSPSVSLLRPDALKKVCAVALLPAAKKNPKYFFEQHFQPFQVIVDEASNAFFTGYFQPEISGSLVRSAAFPTPVYGLPRDLVVLPSGSRVGRLADLTAARRGADGVLEPYPDRAAIDDGALEAGGARKLVFLKDRVDLFLAQVQGSARVQLQDGRVLHLAFAGRNGQPYVALARILVQRGVAPASEMTMRRLTDWLRQNGLERGEGGDELLRLNRSYVFFDASFDTKPNEQPSGSGGARLSPLRSIAIDSHIWPYGLPFFIDARLPWRGPEADAFQRLAIAQDTGSAIVGAARADIYFGLGNEAGARAGEIRHHGRFFVLLPKE